MYQFNSENESVSSDALENTKSQDSSANVIGFNDEVTDEALDFTPALKHLPSTLIEVASYVNLTSSPAFKKSEISQNDILNMLLKAISDFFNENSDDLQKQDELLPHMLAVAIHFQDFWHLSNQEERVHFKELDQLFYDIGLYYDRKDNNNEASFFFDIALLHINTLGVARTDLEDRKQKKINILRCLGNSDLKLGNIDRAKQHMEKALAAAESFFGIGNYRLVNILIDIADVYAHDLLNEREINSFKIAKSLRRARSIQQRRDNPDQSLMPIIEARLNKIENNKLPESTTKDKNSMYYEEQRKKCESNNNNNNNNNEKKRKLSNEGIALSNKAFKEAEDDEITSPGLKK